MLRKEITDNQRRSDSWLNTATLWPDWKIIQKPTSGQRKEMEHNHNKEALKTRRYDETEFDFIKFTKRARKNTSTTDREEKNNKKNNTANCFANPCAPERQGTMSTSWTEKTDGTENRGDKKIPYQMPEHLDFQICKPQTVWQLPTQKYIMSSLTLSVIHPCSQGTF